MGRKDKKQNKIAEHLSDKDISVSDILTMKKVEDSWKQKRYLLVLKLVKKTDFYLNLKKEDPSKLKILEGMYYLVILGIRIKSIIDIIGVTKLIKKIMELGFQKTNLDLAIYLTFLNKEELSDEQKSFLIQLIENKNSFEGFDELGDYFHQNNQVDEAINSYQNAIKLNKNEDTYLKIGNIYYEKEEYHKALDFYKKVIKIDMNNEDALIGIGYSYYHLERYHRGISFLKKALILNNQNNEAYSGLGYCYLMSNEYRKAIKSFKKSIELNSNDDNNLIGLGSSYYNLEKYDEAIKAYEKAIKINPSNDITYGYLGVLYHEIEKYDEAIKAYKKAIKINHDNEITYENLGNTYLEQERYDDAIKSYKKAIEGNPDFKSCHKSLKDIYLKQKRYEEVIKYYEEDYEKIIRRKLFKSRNSELSINPVIKKLLYKKVTNSSKYKNQYIEEIKDLYFRLAYEYTNENFIFYIKKATSFEDNDIFKLLIERYSDKIEEKNKAIQNLYHNLKNKIPKIYFSIENIIEDLEDENKEIPNTLINSLTIAKDLEDTANTVLGASKISKYYLLSAIKNQSNQISFKEMINNSILNALSYISLEESDNNIIKKFNINNMDEVLEFIKNKLFNIKLDINYLENCYLSKENIIDNKYPVTSVLSNLFDELMINLFKYTIKDGFIDIKTLNKNDLIFIFKNKSNTNNDKKSTGKGRYIIETTIQSIGGKYEHYWENDIYITKISFKNYWSKNG